MTEPASHTLAYLRRLDEKLDRLGSEVGDRFDRVEGRFERVESRLDQIADELLVLNGIVLRLEGREIETTGLKAMLDRHERWLGDLGRRIDELEGEKRE
jgi:hypothetical protein